MDISASSTDGGHLTSNTGETPEEAWAGPAYRDANPDRLCRAGQRYDGFGYLVWQSFVAFDLSAVQDVPYAALELWVEGASASDPFTLHAAPYAFPAGWVQPAAWQDRAELAALTPVASLASDDLELGAYNAFTGDLAAALVPGAVNGFVIYSDRNRDGLAPTGFEYVELHLGSTEHPGRILLEPATVPGPVPVYVTVEALRLATGAGHGTLQDERLTLCCILGSRYVDQTVGIPIADESHLTPPFTIALVPCPPAYMLAAMTAAVRFTKSQDLPFGAVGGLGDLAVYVRGQTIPEVDLILTGHRLSWGVA